MKSTVISARVPKQLDAKVKVLAQLRGVYRQDIVIASLESLLRSAPEREQVERLLALCANSEATA